MTLAQWSNLFVYASMAIYAMAMVAFAASFASAGQAPWLRLPPRIPMSSPWPSEPSRATAPRRHGLLPGVGPDRHRTTPARPRAARPSATPARTPPSRPVAVPGTSGCP